MTTSKITSIRIPDPVLNIISTDHMVHNEENQELWASSAKFIDDSFLDVDGSLKPASVSISEAKPTILRVGLHVADEHRGKLFHLEARLRGKSRIACSGTLNAKTSDITVDVNFRPPWVRLDFPWDIAGDLIWKIVQTEQSSATAVKDLEVSTRLEIYGLTSDLPKFFYERVHVNFLRALVLPARTSNALDWTRYVIKSAFWDFGFIYAAFDGGRARYAGSKQRGTYDLREWTREVGTRKPLNCYDQAGLVQIALGLGPLQESRVKWKFMDLFGLLSTTQLIGRSACNDPFPNTKAQIEQDTPMLVADDSDNRSMFRNHAFIEVDGRIADACAGPHMASEDLEEYIAQAVQKSKKSNWYS